jgi:hypothetical protein
MGLPSLPILLIIAAALSVIAVACTEPYFSLFVVISLACWVVIPTLTVLAATELVKSVLGTFDNPTCVL